MGAVFFSRAPERKGPKSGRFLPGGPWIIEPPDEAFKPFPMLPRTRPSRRAAHPPAAPLHPRIPPPRPGLLEPFGGLLGGQRHATVCSLHVLPHHSALLDDSGSPRDTRPTTTPS